MYKLLQRMLLMALLCMPLVTMSQGNGFSCDFESDGEATAWNVSDEWATNTWYVGTATHNGTGTHALYISDDNGLTHQYTTDEPSAVFAYRTITLEAGSYEVSYDWVCAGEESYGEIADYLRVALAPANTNFLDPDLEIEGSYLPQGWISLDGEGAMMNANTWTTYNGSVAIPTTGSYYFVVYWFNDYYGGNQPPAAIDNISFIMPTCPTPSNLQVSGIIENQATITWTDGGAASSWIVTYAPANAADPSATISQTVAQPFLSISGLEYNTDYNVTVQADCGNGDQSSVASTTFRSACGALTLPYRESFENEENYSFPACWTTIPQNTNVYVDINYSYAPTTTAGEKSLRTANNCKIVTPYIPLQNNLIVVDFLAKPYMSGAGSIEVSFLSDLDHPENLVPVDTITPINTNIEAYSIDFSSMENIAEGGYIVFRQFGASMDYLWFNIDDIHIRQISECRRPSSVTATHVKHNSAIIRWRALQDVAQYEIKYSTVNDIEDATNAQTATTNTNEYTLNNLNSETTYYIWVRSICGTRYSEWSPMASFSTQVSCAPVKNATIDNISTSGAALRWDFNTNVGAPMTEVMVAWKAADATTYTTANTTNNYFFLTGLESGTEYEYAIRTVCSNDTASMVMGSFYTLPCGNTIDGGTATSSYFPSHANFGYSYTQMFYSANQLTGLSTINGIAFRYKKGNSLARNFDVYLANTSHTTISSSDYLPADSLTLVADNVEVLTHPGWVIINFTTPFVYDGHSNIVVAVDDNTNNSNGNVEVYCHEGGSSIYFYRDNVDIDPIYNENFYNFYKVPDIIFCSTCPATACAAPLLTIGEITTNTIEAIWTAGGADNNWVVDYKLQSETAWTNATAATTSTTYTIGNLIPGSFYDIRVGSICGTDTLYSTTEAFTECGAINAPYTESFDAGLNACITLDGPTPNSIPRVQYNALLLGFEGGGYAILPEFIDEINTLRMSYTLTGSPESQVVIAVGTDNTDWNTFVPIDTVTMRDYQPEFHYTYFHHYLGEGHYIAIQSLSDFVKIDDITVEEMPVCAMPLDLVVSDITDEAATLSWIGDNGQSDNWLIQWRNIETNEAFEDVTLETNFTIVGLNSDSEYEITVTNLCGTDSIHALETITFRTHCSDIVLPYVERFETRPTFEFPSCWQEIAGYNMVEEHSNYTTDGNQVLTIDDDAIIASPFVPLPGNSIALDFLLKYGDEEGSGRIVVGFTPSLDNLDAMEVVDTVRPATDQCTQISLNFSNISSTDEGYIVWKQIERDPDCWGNTAYYLDRIYIREIPQCANPANLTVNQITYDQAYLTWTPQEGITSYEVMYSTVDDMNSMNNLSETINDNAITLQGLDANTTYYVWLRSICPTGGNSDWFIGGSFTTQVSCAQLASVDIAQVTNNGVSMSWTYNNAIGIAASEVEVAWKAQNADDFSSIITDNNYYILSGLESNTQYQLRLRTICGEDTAEAYTETITTHSCGITLGEQQLTSTTVPANVSWCYSYNQMLYPATELAGLDTIRSIAFNWAEQSSTTLNLNVYMGHTKRSELTTSGSVAFDSLTLVADSVTYNLNPGWCSIILATPFVYHNDSNLVIAIDNNTGNYPWEDKNFYVHAGNTIHVYNDYNDIIPSETQNWKVCNYVPDIQFPMPCATGQCEAPLLIVGNTTSNSAQLVWRHGNAGETWQVEYKLADATDWTIAQTNVTDTTATITGLLSGADYNFRVGTNCSGTLLYSMVNGITKCSAIDAPITEAFDGATSTRCWSFGNLNPENRIPTINSNEMLHMADPQSYLVTPEFTNNLSTLHILFDATTMFDGSQIIVAVGNDPIDFSVYTTIDTIDIPKESSNPTQEVALFDYVGTGHYIALYCPTGRVYLDNITVETAPLCSYPTQLQISNIAADSAIVTWQGNSQYSNGWTIEYNVFGQSEIQSANVAANVHSYTLTHLNPNTKYEVIVKNTCTNDTIAAFAPVLFRTECGVMTLPYFEGFEFEEAETFHACWTTSTSHMYGNFYNPETAPIITNDNVHGNILKFCDNVEMVSPLVPTTGSNIVVNFDALASYPDFTGDLVIGFTTNPTDTANVIGIDTIQFNDFSWNNYEVAFSSLNTNDTGYVVFKNINNTPEIGWDGDASYYDGFIDNITFMENTGCNRVTDVTISNITAASATINFTDANDINNYTIGYSTTNDCNNINDTVHVTDTTYTLTGLTPMTTYYVWVRTNCLAGVSPWTLARNFSTSCNALNTLPYEENFDSYTDDIASSPNAPENYPFHSMPDCWNFNNLSTSRNDSPQAFLRESAYLADSANCLFFKSKKGTSIYAIMPEFATPVSSLQISFSYCHEGVSPSNGNLTLGVMTNANDSNSFVPLKALAQVDEVSYVTHNFAIDQLTAGTNYRIAFRYTGGTGSNYYMAIDKIIVEQADACPTPENLVLTNITTNDASLSWNGASSSYNVQYRADEATTWTDAPAVSTNTITLSGLTEQTAYFARVRGVCGASTSQWSDSVRFVTPCGMMAIPYTENFDSYTDDVSASDDEPITYPNHTMPSCWSFPGLAENGPKAFLSRHSNYAESGNCLFFKSSRSNDIFAVLPAMNVPIDSLSISFTYCNEGTSNANSPITIGVMTNPNETGTFQALEVYPRSSDKTAVEHIFSTDSNLVDGTTYYIAFRYGGGTGNNYFLGLDNVVVDYAPTCPRLAAPTLDSVASHYAELSWTGTANAYEIGYKLNTDSVWTILTSTANSIALSALEPASNYQARVRAICAANDTSEWSAELTFITECAALNLPFFEDFTDYHGSFPQCWTRYKGLLSEIQAGTAQLEEYSGGWSTYGTSYQVNNGGVNAHLNIYGTSTKTWLVTPELNITAGTELTFDIARRDDNDIWGDDDQFVVLATSDNGNTWTALQTWSGTTYQNIPLYSATADSINIALNQYSGQTIRIAFYGESTVKNGDHYLYIDNIEVSTDIPVCVVPTDLIADDLTATTANLSWNGTAATYDVEYRIQSSTDWTTNNITATTLALTNLQPLTTYEWRVRGNCGDLAGTSEWATSTFTTLDIPCTVPTNLTATVNGNSVTIDWNADENQSSWEVIVYTTDTLTQIANAHPITIDDLYGATTYSVQVRTICDEETYSDWTDAVQFTTDECQKVTNLAASNVTTTSAKITWSASDNQSRWEINYGEANFDQSQGETEIVSATTYNIAGLQPDTDYEVYVRALCGSDYYSLWSDVLTFHTLAETPEGIDGVDGQFQFNIYPNPTNGATTITLNGVEGQVTISVVDMNGRTVTSESLECGSDCQKRIDVTNLAQGTYFVRLLGDNINSVRKLIVR